MTEHRFMVTELRSGIGNNDKGGSERRHDLESFEGGVTLSPVNNSGQPDYGGEIDLTFNDEAEYKAFNLGEVYTLTLTKEEPVEPTVAAGAGFSGASAG